MPKYEKGEYPRDVEIDDAAAIVRGAVTTIFTGKGLSEGSARAFLDEMTNPTIDQRPGELVQEVAKHPAAVRFLVALADFTQA